MNNRQLQNDTSEKKVLVTLYIRIATYKYIASYSEMYDKVNCVKCLT